MKSKRDVMQGRNIENDEYKGIYQKIVFLQMCDEEFPKLYIEYVCIEILFGYISLKSSRTRSF